jgi:hypothetical protein
MVAYAYDPITWGSDAEGSQVWSQPELHSKNLFKKKNNKKERKNNFQGVVEC